MKKTEITKVEIACLKGMLQENIPVATMAKQLNRSASSLNKQISSIKAQQERERLFLTKTSGGQDGVTIMTEAASVKTDTSRAVNTPPQERSLWIHQIRPDGKK